MSPSRQHLMFSENDLLIAAQKTNLYVDTLPMTRKDMALPRIGSR